MRQTGSYAEYVDKFEELKEYMLLEVENRFTEDYFVSSFLSGLSEELQSSIYMFHPTTLEQTIELGRKQILTLEAIAQKLKPASTPLSQFSPGFRRVESPHVPPYVPTKPTVSHPSKPPTKLLTAAEMFARREKGLCYNCDKKYVFGHRCKNVILYMVMTEEEELLYAHDAVEMDTSSLNGASVPEVEEVQMSIHSLLGEGGPITMRVVGEVGDQKLNILLDSGSTLSFF